MKSLFIDKEKTKIMILASDAKFSRIGIYDDTGDLVINKPGKDIPKGIPVDLFIVDIEDNEIYYGFLFTTSDSYDEIYYCTQINNDSVSGAKITYENNNCVLDKSIFTEFPLKNVRRVSSTSIQNMKFGNVRELHDEAVEEIVDIYNKNPNNIMFQH